MSHSCILVGPLILILRLVVYLPHSRLLSLSLCLSVLQYWLFLTRSRPLHCLPHTTTTTITSS